MPNYSEKFMNTWESYNGFALFSIILGVICFFFPWFQKINIYFINLPPEYLHIHELFYYDLHTSLFGLLYLFGFLFLIFYYTGVLLKNRGDYGTPFESHANSFFKLSVFTLITFEVLMFLHFVAAPNWDSGWFSWFYHWVHIEYWKIDSGFVIGLYMISAVITSFYFDKTRLRRHYKKYLPEFQPGQDQAIDEKDLELTSLSTHSRIAAFILIAGLIALSCFVYVVIVYFT